MDDKSYIDILSQMKDGDSSDWNKVVDRAIEAIESDTKMTELLKYMDGVGDFWKEQMPMMTMEEMAELTQAISKFERYIYHRLSGYDPEEYVKRKEAIETEMADVIISIRALAHWYNLDSKDILVKVIKKLGVVY